MYLLCLSERTIPVRGGLVLSQPFTVISGVSEGSILVPSLFLRLSPILLFCFRCYCSFLPSLFYHSPSHERHRSGSYCSQWVASDLERISARGSTSLICLDVSMTPLLSRSPEFLRLHSVSLRSTESLFTEFIHKIFSLLVCICVDICLVLCARLI